MILQCNTLGFKTGHRGQNSKQINIAIYDSKYLIGVAKRLEKCVKSQKKSCTLSFFAKSSKVKWRPLKQTKLKNWNHFSIPLFHDIQLCFWFSGDSYPIKVFKMYFVFV